MMRTVDTECCCPRHCQLLVSGEHRYRDTASAFTGRGKKNGLGDMGACFRFISILMLCL